jgi:lipid II:glycine glycyltransferase (peptidoglycan interpeptide bridge formation enzyme)
MQYIMAAFTYSPVSDKDYSALIKKASYTTFYNSPERLQFIKKRNRKLSLFQITKDDSVVALACYQVIPARSGEFVYFQHSPVFIDPRVAEDLDFWLELKQFAQLIGRKENAVYVRFTPRVPNNKEVVADILTAGYKRAPVQELDACVTRTISIPQYSEQRLTVEHAKSLEKAQKAGLSVSFSSTQEALEDFVSIYRTLSAKHQVDYVPVDYLKEELRQYLDNNELVIATVKDSKDVISSASAIVIQDNQAWNYWTATTDQGRTFGTDVLILHETIGYLKQKNMTIFDLWGGAVAKDIADKGLPHPWKALDIFKQGFGAILVEYLPALDITIKTPQYMAAVFYQRALMTKRGYPYIPLKG